MKGFTQNYCSVIRGAQAHYHAELKLVKLEMNTEVVKMSL